MHDLANQLYFPSLPVKCHLFFPVKKRPLKDISSECFEVILSSNVYFKEPNEAFASCDSYFNGITNSISESMGD